MKTITFLLLSVFIGAAALRAQPTVSTNEFYHIGDVIQMVPCSTDGITAGEPGANMTWDFSALAPASGTIVTTVAHDTAVAFLTANLLITLPDGKKQHMQENNTDSYLLGIEDTASGVIAYYNNNDIAKRPMTFMTYFTDTYTVVIPAALTHGKGNMVMTGDGYGTLILPHGTYNNVLRIKKLQTEIDTINGIPSSSTTVSYLWFDTLNSPPLLRIDSVIAIVGGGNTVMYLAQPTAIPNVNRAQSNYTAYLDDNGLRLSGDLVYGKNYEVVVYNIIGAKIFSREFIAAGNNAHFDIGRQVEPGMYMVCISQKNDAAGRGIIKVVKQ